jgi:hypothetical protein
MTMNNKQYSITIYIYSTLHCDTQFLAVDNLPPNCPRKQSPDELYNKSGSLLFNIDIVSHVPRVQLLF